jgi:hypothetical protein
MGQNERMSADWFRRLLRCALPSRVDELDRLLDELMPVFEVDRDDERILFQAQAGTPG